MAAGQKTPPTVAGGGIATHDGMHLKKIGCNGFEK